NLVVGHCIRTTLRGVDTRLANTEHEARNNEMLAIIRKAAGDGITQTDLYVRTKHWGEVHRNESMRWVLASERVVMRRVRRKGTTNLANVYYAIEHAPKLDSE